MPTEEEVRRVKCLMCLGEGRGFWQSPEWRRPHEPECEYCLGEGWVRR